ncbi:unnamed protein product, partial [marine sediment metagenome]
MLNEENNNKMSEVLRIQSVTVIRERKNETTFEAVLVKRNNSYYFKGFFYKEKALVERSTAYLIHSITKKETKIGLVQQFVEILTNHFLDNQVHELEENDLEENQPSVFDPETPPEGIEDVKTGQSYLIKLNNEDSYSEMVAVMNNGVFRFVPEHGGSVSQNWIASIKEIKETEIEELPEVAPVDQEKQLIEKKNPFFSVSLVYKEGEVIKLYAIIVKDSQSKEEALGKAFFTLENKQNHF